MPHPLDLLSERSKAALKDPVIKGVSCNDLGENNAFAGLGGLGTGKIGTVAERRRNSSGFDDIEMLLGVEEKTIMSHVGKPATQKNATVMAPSVLP